MYVASRRDRVVDPTRQVEVAQRVTDGLIPLLRHGIGLVACYVVTTDDGDVIMISMFADRNGAETAAHLAADWVPAHLDGLVADSAEVVLGEVWA